MYDSTIISQNVKHVARIKDIQIGKMLAECDLGINALANMNSGRMPLADNLAKLADYLDVSVDYLLGRTDKPEVNR